MNDRIEFSSAGFREILVGSEMASLVEGEANRIAASANRMSGTGGYEPSVKQMGSRVIASVRAETIPAMIDNGKHNTLLRALGGGG